MLRQGRILSDNWDLYDTRHVVFQPAGMSPQALESGYWRAYRDFYRWSSIWRGASSKPDWKGTLRHLAYAGGWKKFEPLWDMVIRLKRLGDFLPLLESILNAGKPSSVPGLRSDLGDIAAQQIAYPRNSHRADEHPIA
jgi:hypothetical protein